LLSPWNDDDVDLLADRGGGDDARQVIWLLDVLAAKLDDDVARLDSGGFAGALVIDAGDQRDARRQLMFEVSAISSVT